MRPYRRSCDGTVAFVGTVPGWPARATITSGLDLGEKS